MTTRALIISNDVSEQIRAADARARTHPVSWERMQQFAIVSEKTHVALSDRPPGFKREPSEFVSIPDGFTAAISYEYQPAGLCRHLSVSVDGAGRVPSPPAVEMIAAEFGFELPLVDHSRIWIEEYRPGKHAINVVQIAEPAQ